MRTLTNELGAIHITPEFVSKLIADGALSCEGVSDLASGGTPLGLHSIFLGRDTLNKGVKVKKEEDGLVVELHVIIQFGVVISEVVKAVVGKVRFTVENCIDMPVSKVDVYVDGMKND